MRSVRLVVVGVLMSLAACSAAAKVPVLASAPTKAPVGVIKAVRGTDVCQAPTDGLAPSGGSSSVWLDRDPIGGTVLWLPGLNSKTCRGVLTRINHARAVAFAAAVDAAQPFRDGTYRCPNDDGSSATVFLEYANRRLAEVVRVRIGGCGGITAPGRSGVSGAGLNYLGPGPDLP